MAPVLGLFGYTAGADPRVGYGATFSRADASTCATYVDVNGVVQTVAANIPRYAHYVNGNGPTLLLEGSRTNLLKSSEALNNAAWTAVGAPTVTNAVGTYAGLSFSRLAYVTNWATNYVRTTANVGFTGNATKAISIFAKQDGANIGTFTVYLTDTIAPADRLVLTLTVAAGGAITGAASTGTLLRTVALADGVYRFECVTTSVTAANNHYVYLGLVGTCPSILLAGEMAEDAAFPSSYIPTTSAAVTRAADSITWPVAFAEQALTAYLSGYDLGTQAGSLGYFGIGNATTKPSIYAYGSSSTVLKAGFDNGSAVVLSSGITSSIALGNQIELRLPFLATGVVQLGLSRNGAAETTDTASSGQALGSGFGGNVLLVNDYDGSHTGFLALSSLKVAAGVQTLATMRTLAIPSITTTTTALAVSSLDAIVAAYGQPAFTVIDTGTGTALTATATPRADQQVRLLKLNVTFSASPSGIPIIVYDGDTTILWKGYTSATGPFSYHFNFTRKPLRSSRGNALSVCVPSGGAAVVGTVSWDGDFVRAP